MVIDKSSYAELKPLNKLYTYPSLDTLFVQVVLFKKLFGIKLNVLNIYILKY